MSYDTTNTTTLNSKILFYKLPMLSMERNLISMSLSSLILLCARIGDARVLQQYEKLFSNVADKYGKELNEQKFETRRSGTYYFSKIKESITCLRKNVRNRDRLIILSTKFHLNT